MATVKQIIKSALRYCAEQTNYTIAANEDYDDGLHNLNTLVQMWFELGLDLAASADLEIDNIANQFNYPAYSFQAFETNLAVMLWPLYNIEKPLPGTLMMLANDSKNQLFSIASIRISSVYPGTLPKGMGNWEAFQNPFYPDCSTPVYNSCGGVLTEGCTKIITEEES